MLGEKISPLKDFNLRLSLDILRAIATFFVINYWLFVWN